MITRVYKIISTFFLILSVSYLVISCNKKSDNAAPSPSESDIFAFTPVADTQQILKMNNYDIVKENFFDSNSNSTIGNTNVGAGPQTTDLQSDLTQEYLHQGSGLGCYNDKGLLKKYMDVQTVQNPVEPTNGSIEKVRSKSIRRKDGNQRANVIVPAAAAPLERLSLGETFKKESATSSANFTTYFGFTITLSQIRNKDYQYSYISDFLKSTINLNPLPVNSLYSSTPHGSLIYSYDNYLKDKEQYHPTQVYQFVPDFNTQAQKFNLATENNEYWNCSIKDVKSHTKRTSLLRYEFNYKKVNALLVEKKDFGPVTCVKSRFDNITKQNITLSTVVLPNGESSSLTVLSKDIRSPYAVSCDGEVLYYSYTTKNLNKILDSYTQKLTLAPFRN